MRPGTAALAQRAVGRVAWRVLLLVCVCASAVAIVAVADHRDKQRRAERAELAEWYCSHLGTFCGGVSSAKIERRWNEREVVYKGAMGVLVALGAASALGFRPRRR